MTGSTGRGASGPHADGAQENIAIAGKYAGGARGRITRDWQLFLFFRILSHAEALAAAASDATEPAPSGSPGSLTTAEEIALADPGLFPARAATLQRASQDFETTDTSRAAPAFRQWLGHVSGARADGTLSPATLAQLAAELTVDGGTKASGDDAPVRRDDAGRVIGQGLVAVIHYEILRHHWLAGHGGAGGAVRPHRPATEPDADAPAFDPASINIAFTYNGLKHLRLNPLVLRSFPDAFRDGMAARAARLHDTGPSAPEAWYGELGSARIHGYFTGGFAADDAPESAWRALRREIDRFNTRDPSAVGTRGKLRTLFARLGMELMHIELGQAPYAVGAGDQVMPILPRVEHFGYRDGVSQPFVDMKLDAGGRMTPPPPGGATPSRDRTWTPLATGEVYLGYPDEDGHCIEQPANRRLRLAGTYLVFRKLAQDVGGFRSFLRMQRPGSVEAQDRLGAQIVGRWKNGRSLVAAPLSDQGGDEARLNDFRYAGQDPRGEKCPIGAHVRRANPRDIGGRNNVRRHRLMRRSIGYGGALLQDGAQPDGEERGLLFVAANARIDMQFELVQGDWLNRGEFLGQAGLGRCPLTGAHDGGVEAAFLESGKGAPVTGLPRFVTLRGGDYFFAPSVDALRGLADEAERFPPETPVLAARGHSFGDGRTEGLFSEERLSALAMEVLLGVKSPVGYRLPAATWGQAAFGPAPPPENPDQTGDVIVVRSHADVRHVLSSKPDPKTGRPAFAAAHARIAGRRMLGRGDLLVGADWQSDPPDTRGELLAIMREAWDRRAVDWRRRLEEIVVASLRQTTARVAPAGRIDLVRDLAADSTFAVVTRLFGVDSPGYLTELAMATPFGRRHVGQVHPDWLLTHGRAADDNPGLVTLKVWAFLVGLNLVGDMQLQRPVIALGQQAASETLLHIDELVARARERRPDAPETLISTLVGLESRFTGAGGMTVSTYYDHVRSLVFELALTASAIVPAVFGKLMDAVFRFGIDLSRLVPLLEASARQRGASPDDGIVALIYELNRLDPALPLVLRRCEADGGAVLPSKVRVAKGQWVAALVAGANLDAAAFPSPDQFSLGEALPGGPPRMRSDYLMFGVQDARSTKRGSRLCWGRDRIALHMLVQCLRTASRLPGLRRIPGPGGELKKLLGIASGLTARFAPFTPD